MNRERSLHGRGIWLSRSSVDVKPEGFRSDCISLFAAIRRSEGSASVVNGAAERVLIENKFLKLCTGRKEGVELFVFMNHQRAFEAFRGQYSFEERQRCAHEKVSQYV